MTVAQPLTAWQIDEKAIFEPTQENLAGFVLQKSSAWPLELFAHQATVSSRLRARPFKLLLHPCHQGPSRKRTLMLKAKPQPAASCNRSHGAAASEVPVPRTKSAAADASARWACSCL